MSSGKPHRVRRGVLLGLAVFLGGFLAIELVVRIATLRLFTWEGRDDPKYGMVVPFVGHVPKPNISISNMRKGRAPLEKGFSIHVDGNSTRLNGGFTPKNERPLTLVTGDSFAFGDEVEDGESWPANLERLTDRRVINGGIPGFAIDQSELWAERLALQFKPDNIIVSFIPINVTGCGNSYLSGSPKAYFEIDKGGWLQLHATPVKPPSWDADIRDLLSHSMVIDGLFSRYLHWEQPDTQVTDRATDIACLLMGRLAAFGREQHARVVVFAHPKWLNSSKPELDLKDGVLECARRNHLQVLDLFPAIDKLDEAQRKGLYHGHFTPAGNHWVAEQVKAFLDSNPQTPPPL